MILKKMLEVELKYDEDDSFGVSPREDFNYFKQILSHYNPNADFDFLFKAFAFLVFYHRKDKRKSGKPYYTHPLWVAIFLIEKFNVYDELYLAAAFLHDTIEDTAFRNDKVTKQTIIDKFGNIQLAEIVEALTKISTETLQLENENFKNELLKKYSKKYTEDIIRNKEIQKCFTHRKLFQTFVKDQNIIIIKLADRLHNMYTLHYVGNDEKAKIKQKNTSVETLEFYVGFASRLGFINIATELQNLSFYFADKELYTKIREIIESKESYIIERLKIYQNDIDEAFKDLNITGISTHIYHRQEYEIYNLTNNFQNIDNLTDYVTCIISVPTQNVYELTEIASSLIKKFGLKQFTTYQEGKQNIGEYEFDTFQIRVKKPDFDGLDITLMREEDHDILQNFTKVQIKEKRAKKRIIDISDNELELWSNWVELIILEKGERAINDIWDSIDKNFFNDRILCYSIDKKEVYLPQNASIIDFAFALSEEIGLNFGDALIQEKVYDFDYRLSGNETIQILKSPNPSVNILWKNYLSDYRALGYYYKHIGNIQHPRDLTLIKSAKVDEPLSDTIKILNAGFYGKLLIKGLNRVKLLNDITSAIGNSEIRKTTIQKIENDNSFEGVFEVFFNNANDFNKTLLNLLNVRGVKSAELVKVWFASK
jgi:GTP pyrophosphokinase